MYTLSSRHYSLMAVAYFSRIMCLSTKQKWFRNVLKSKTMILRCSFDLNQIEHLWDLLDKQVQSMEAPPQLTGLQGSSTNILVPNTKEHLEGSGLLWQQKGDQRDIWQAVIMLCLSAVIIFLKNSLCCVDRKDCRCSQWL